MDRSGGIAGTAHRQGRWSRAEAVGVAIAAAVVSGALLLGSGAPSFWFDELATVSAARRSLVDLWWLTSHIDLVHLPYYVVMHVWLTIAPTNEFSLRLPSALAVAATVPLIYAIGRRLGGVPVGAVAVVAFLVLPRTLWMAGEGRSFAIATLWACAVALLFFRALAARRRGALHAAVLAVCGALAVLFWIYNVAVLVALLVVVPFFIASRRAKILVAGALSLAILAATPFLLAVSGQRGQVGGTRPTGVDLPSYVLAEQYFLNATATAWGFWIVFAVAGAAAIGRARRSPHATRGAWPLLAAWLLLPLLVVVAASRLLGHSLYQPRAMAITAPALALLFALTFVRATAGRTRVAITLAAATAVAAAVPVFLQLREPTAKGTDWREAAGVAASYATGDTALVFVDNTTELGLVSEAPSTLTVGYEATLSSLTDPTLLAGAAESGGLWPVRGERSSWTEVLPGHDRIVVVRGTHDGASETVEAAALLEGLGFARELSTTLPYTTVEVWTRG